MWMLLPDCQFKLRLVIHQLVSSAFLFSVAHNIMWQIKTDAEWLPHPWSCVHSVPCKRQGANEVMTCIGLIAHHVQSTGMQGLGTAPCLRARLYEVPNIVQHRIYMQLKHASLLII